MRTGLRARGALPLLLAALLLAAAPPAARAQPGAFAFPQMPLPGSFQQPAPGAPGATVVSSSSVVSSAAPAAGAAPACATLVKTATSSCSNGVCCAIEQRVTACPDHTTAVAKINGVPAACCVVLVSKKTGVPAAFCATPKPKAGARTFPASATVTLDPRCSAGPGGGAAAALSCSARFEKLPRGFALPARQGAPLTMAAGKAAPWAGAGLTPCQGAFGQFTQTATVEKGTRATLFSVQCS